MKKLIEKIKKLNNHGSSIVMVVVALGFIGIIIGALLSAAGSAYKLKVQNKNSKNNFYYVEQAMQEIYAGIGSNTIEEMKAAYAYTVENMVRFEPNIGTYITISDDEANEMFKDKFMQNILESDYFAQGDIALANALEGYISNDTVKLDKTKLSLQVESDRIVIKDVTLTRVQDYDKSSGAGTYVQTISTDIVISEPDFKVRFNNMVSDYSGIFEYALVGDMGVQIANNDGLKINGNVYASADYYNKTYNKKPADGESTVFDSTAKDDKGNPKYSFNLSPVTGKDPADLTDSSKGYVNKEKDSSGKNLTYDGENVYSMNSGLFMTNSNVTIIGDRVIVPGTVAVMDSSDLTVFGSAGEVSEVWADNIVLGGSTKITPKDPGDTSKGVNYEGSTALFGGNLYVRDDTELNAKGSNLTIHGSYYGYGNSTSKDTRVFVDTVNKRNFQIITNNGTVTTTENRGHYNSSSIVINGEYSKLDLSETKKLFLAGRAYIELSKKVDGKTSDDGKKYSETFTYAPTYENANKETVFVRDYKTAESISIKSNQVMYNITSLGTVSKRTIGGKEYDVISLSGKPNAQLLFKKYFPEVIFGSNVPCVKEVVDSKEVYLIDFKNGYKLLNEIKDSTGTTYTTEQKTAATTALNGIDSENDYTLKFAMDYVEHVTNVAETELKDITTYDEFDAGTVVIGDTTPDPADVNNTAAKIYSSGAITTKNGSTFTMVTNNDGDVLEGLLGSNTYKDDYIYNASDNTYSYAENAFLLSKDLETEYNYIKWNLDHNKEAVEEKAYVQSMITEKGESITPIHKYIIMSKVNKVFPTMTTDTGYKVFISNGDIKVADGNNKSISGIVIAKGDVDFSDKVESFEGMIIAGGKIYIGENLKSLVASPNVCRGVLRDLIVDGSDAAIEMLNVFKEYENYKADGTGGPGNVDNEQISIDTIDYSQVVSMTNWMKNVGGVY